MPLGTYYVLGTVAGNANKELKIRNECLTEEL